MRLPTVQEKIKAVMDTRKDVAQYLDSIGKLDAFADFSSDDICGLVRACAEGVQKSLKEQTRTAFEDDSEIPF